MRPLQYFAFSSFLACVQTLQSVRRNKKEKKAPCRVCATGTNSMFPVLRICGTICDWLHDLTFFLTCAQHLLLVTNFRIMFVTRKITCSNDEMIEHETDNDLLTKRSRKLA